MSDFEGYLKQYKSNFRTQVKHARTTTLIIISLYMRMRGRQNGILSYTRYDYAARMLFNHKYMPTLQFGIDILHV